MNATARARAYLAKLPPAIAGQGGHATTFAAACRLVEFGLAFDEALPLLADWNQHCQPPWSEPELRHKLADAFKRTKPKPEFVTARSRAANSGDGAHPAVVARNGGGRRMPAPALLLITAASQVPPAPTTETATADLQRSAHLALARLTLTAGTTQQHAKLAQLRGLSVQAVALASERGLLRFAKYHGNEAWFILDASQRNAVARRMDGQPWKTRLGDAKAVMVKGSQGAWPIGILEAAACHVLLLVEGGPDLLAAFHFIIKARRERDCAPVAMAIGSPPIHADALRLFAGKRARIYGHADSRAGSESVNRWSAQLTGAGADVDAFSFAGLRQCDGSPVKDLNDFVRLHPDDERKHGLEVLP